MGYCYTASGKLVCDGCGRDGGVRRRTCPHTVLCDSLRGARSRLPWCSAQALCKDCYAARGGLRGLHGTRCEQGAREDQAEADAIEAALDAGEAFVLAAWGDWQAGVPQGQAGVLFGSRAGKAWRLVPDAAYDPQARPKLSDYPDAQPWQDHPAG